MAACLPGGGDAVVELYKAALLAPDGAKPRSGKGGQKKPSKKERKGKVRAHERVEEWQCCFVWAPR